MVTINTELSQGRDLPWVMKMSITLANCFAPCRLFTPAITAGNLKMFAWNKKSYLNFLGLRLVG